ncbi:MAG: GspH/FimT family pseudopilin [Gammaproteobacteria bacterium]
MGNQRGFTLAELLITIVILAILAGIGVPALRDVVLSNRQTAAVNDLVTALQVARSHAISRGEGRDLYTAADPTVVVCASADGASCGGGWEDGWIIFRDPDGDGSPAAGDGGVLRVFEGPRSQAISSGGVGIVRFRRDGRVGAPMSFTFCDERGVAYGRSINIDFTGRPSTSKATVCP